MISFKSITLLATKTTNHLKVLSFVLQNKNKSQYKYQLNSSHKSIVNKLLLNYLSQH